MLILMQQTLITSIIMIIISMLLMFNDIMIQIYFPIQMFTSYEFSIGFILDWMSLLFSATVLFISSMIIMFSKSYISNKDHKRFSIILILFILSMVILIFSNNIFFIMLGWDGLGLSSYILVIFYMNSKAKKSGAITILSNRIGDILIIFAIGISLSNNILDMHLSKEFSMVTIILLTIAAMTKSAQLPFSAWLPAAMAAPTPISALVHSSTLVTAGTFLLIRILPHPIPPSNSIILIIASMTMLFSGISANWEQDFKKIIALSTLSQMAMIMFAISINLPLLAFFHLITHALFKSTMFLCAGTLIHSSSYQDIRSQGFNSNWSPSLITSFNITNMSLMGMPFLSGFYSKDTILEMLLANNMNVFILISSILSIGLTASYSLRLLSFSTKFTSKSSKDSTFSFDYFIMFPIILMIPLSIILGSMLSWMIFHSQFISMPNHLKILIPMIIVLGFLLGMLLSFKSKLYYKTGEISSSLWFLNFLSSYPTISISHLGQNSTTLDKSWIELSSAKGSFVIINKLSKSPDFLLYFSLCSLVMLIFIPTLLIS
uniref:NADH-ubiquinone oxidoreductase chain 5 n=1 Tax=Cyriopagopus hainanus TaxID=2781057 RepID=A0A7M1IC32_CYRHA|nr:NADH dehydrogenase subunit 5 [Cyriopagopus hainanus]QOQ36841.1 NADH dehydrogenase subunit 5 [Cyriopagopus hainanus]